LCNMISLSLCPSFSLSTFKVHTSFLLGFSIQFSFTYQTGPPNFSSSVVVQTANPVCVCAVIWIFEEPWDGDPVFWFLQIHRENRVSVLVSFFEEESSKIKESLV
jgi:hypothetical protein